MHLRFFVFFAIVTQIFLINLHALENFCNLKLLQNMDTNPEYSKNDIYVKLNDKSQIPRAAYAIGQLALEPYNEDTQDILTNILLKDNSASNNGTIMDALGENSKILNPYINSLVFMENNSTINKFQTIYKRSSLYSTHIDIYSPTYRNLLVLNAAKLFKYQEDYNKFISSIPEATRGSEVVFQFLYMLNDVENINIESLKTYNANAEEICTNQKLLNEWRDQTTFVTIGNLYILGLQKPEKKEEYKNLAYALGYNSGSWMMFDFYYQLAHKNYIKASNALKELFTIKKFRAEKAQGLLRKYAHVSYLAGLHSSKQSNYFEAYQYALDVIHITKQIAKPNTQDIKIVTEAKTILQESANEIAGHYSLQGEIDNANALLNRTQSALQEMFISYDDLF